MNNANIPDLLGEVADYYSTKLSEHGLTPRGVDYNGEESQILRFAQLGKLIDSSEFFSLNDLGCGYGAYFDYLKKQFPSFSYRGWDVSADMIRAARNQFGDDLNASFEISAEPNIVADYGIACGIFNVRLGCGDVEWRNYLEFTLDILDRTSLKGFAFNCLTSYSDREKMRDYLYYADPCALFDLCKRRYSRNICLLHDYGLYDFTILVRKSV